MDVVQAELRRLQPRVAEMVHRLLRGATPSEVAAAMGVSKHLVHNVRSYVKQTLGGDCEILRALPKRKCTPRQKALPEGHAFVYLWTTVANGHRHIAGFDSNSCNGTTDPGPDGHVHHVRGLELRGDHTHELTDERAQK